VHQAKRKGPTSQVDTSTGKYLVNTVWSVLWCSGKYLVKTDVQSAHHYDLLQHEKLLAMLRRFGKKLYKAHCALGRHLDEMLRHHLSVAAADDDVCTQNVDQVNQVYHELSRELYHCQKLLEIVLDSDMLDRQIVGTCCKRKMAILRECVTTLCVIII